MYFEKIGTPFNLVEEWKAVRGQPKYMIGVDASGSSGSKRKSSGEDVESPAHTFVRPEGRDAAKKKARGSSSKSRKAKPSLDDELSSINAAQAKAEEERAGVIEAMKALARSKDMEMWRYLKNLPDRDDEDEAAYEELRSKLFGK